MLLIIALYILAFVKLNQPGKRKHHIKEICYVVIGGFDNFIF